MNIHMSAIDHAERLAKLLQGRPEDLSDQIKNKIQAKLSEGNGSLLLFGTGELGRKTANILTRHGCKPLAFVDNNANLHGNEILGIPVISINEIKERYSASLVVVTIFTNSPVLQQLKKEKIQAITFTELAWSYPQWFFPFCCIEYPHKIFDCKDDVLSCLGIFGDEKSREEYLGQISWRLSLDRASLPLHEKASETYFANDLFEISDSEVFVDCGSYDGDTIRDFIKRSGGNYSEVIAVEPDPLSREKILRWKETLDFESCNKIRVISEAASDTEGTVRFDAAGTVDSSMGSGTVEVACAPLDKSVGKYHPTFIKMDIEGAEPFALQGASTILREDQPILAVCLYHAQEHLWELPLLIHRLNPDYRLFLRRYSDECWETVCYAIPRSRCK